MYSSTTYAIQVSVRPSFLPEHSDPKERRFVWAYQIDIRNGGAHTVRLRSRHWRITDATGFTEEVDGPGVVGEQPILLPGETFSYTSGCPLRTPSGIMRGEYEMEDDDGERFRVAIPAFSLDLPGETPTLN